MTNPATTLHNHFVKRREENLISYAEVSSGPSSEVVWTVYCKIGGETKGIGTGPQKAAAKQEAARQALEALRIGT